MTYNHRKFRFYSDTETMRIYLKPNKKSVMAFCYFFSASSKSLMEKVTGGDFPLRPICLCRHSFLN
jgi:hypothetical protein